jgi:hypothetical protein
LTCARAKVTVTFHQFKRRMVYELTNWFNSAATADVRHPSAANRS